MIIYYLLVKTHKKTGLKYLCQTTRKNYGKYRGSGKYWKLHIRVHGLDVDTKVIQKCYTQSALESWGLFYSKLWSVVVSNKWANIVPENGSGGAGPGLIGGAVTKNKIWITNGHINKMIHKDENIPDRWRRGAVKTIAECESISKAKLAANKKLTDQEKLNVSVGTKKAMDDPIIKAKCSAPHIKKWIITDPNGNEFSITNLNQFCRDNNLGQSAMKTVAQGRRPTAYGYRIRPQHTSTEMNPQ